LSDTEINSGSPSESFKFFAIRIWEENIVKKFNKIKNKIFQEKNRSFSLSTKELIDVSSAAWREKKYWYLIKREFGLKHDSDWRYSGNLYSTVLQRRFHMDLSLIETIDIDFRDKIPEQYLQSLICNFRVSDPNSKNKWPMSAKHHDVIPHKNIVIRDNYKRNRIFKIRGGKTIRLDMRGLTHYALNPGENVFLEEIIIHLPISLEEVVRMRPVESIQFQKKSERAKAKLTRPLVVQEKKITQFKRNPLDIDALMANLPKWIPLKLDDIDL
jgi:hypothetical protein